MQKQKKINFALYNFSLIIFLTILIVSFFIPDETKSLLENTEFTKFSGNWEINVEGKKENGINLPINYKIDKNEKMILKKSLPLINSKNNYIFFRAKQSDFEIFVENEKIYSYKGQYSFFKRVPGSIWVAAELREDFGGKELRIERRSPYRKYSGVFDEVFLGTKAQIISSVLKNGVFGMGISFFIFILGVISIIISLFLSKLVNSKKILYLGIFSVICSFWSLGELRFLQLFYGNITFVSHLAFLSASMGIISFLMFVSTFDFYAKDRIFNKITMFSIINFLLIIFLHLTGIMDYFESIILTHICIITSVVYISLKFFTYHFKTKLDKDVLNFHINLILFFLIALSDLVKCYAFYDLKLGGGIRLGLCYFILAMTIISIKQLSIAFSEKLEISLLKKIAYTDSLTKLLNRRALDEKIQQLQGEKNGEIYTVITLDMNNLKSINDRYGHHMGDKALASVSNIISFVFKKFGSVYRFGGDEFVVISKKLPKEKTKELLKGLNDRIGESREFGEVKPYIAFGYTAYKSGENFEETLKKADGLMYDCKEKMKKDLREEYIFNN